jgi:hypothetical protein
MSGYHPIIGLCLLCLLALQPATELANHFLHNRYPNAHKYLGHIHVWLGRLLITVGIINGGLGFHYAETVGGVSLKVQKIVYATIATIIWIVYVGVVIVWAELARTAARHAEGEEEAALTEMRGRRDVGDSPNAGTTGQGGAFVGEGNAVNGAVVSHAGNGGFRSSAL